jgi:leucyl aminopeptidase
MVTMITDRIAVDTGQPAGQLWLVTGEGLAAWQAGQPATVGATLSAHRFRAKPGEVVLIPGDGGALHAVAGVASLTASGPWDLAALAEKLPAGSYRLADPALAEAFAPALLGWQLAHYRFERYRSDLPPLPERLLLWPDAAAVSDAQSLARAVARVRDMVTTPAADMGPSALAANVQAVGAAHGADVIVLTGEALLAANHPTIHMVGRAAADPPRLIDLAWGDPAHPKVTLVGKGVCFDSGGLDIKPASGMALMKKDMAGAAHALALAELVMAARLPVRLRLLIPAVENSISGIAFRPGDIVKTRKGLTVEIGNTDAEGRLILCDALALADEDQPAMILDFATLTGAARVALGPELPALFANSDDLADALLASGRAVHDPLWRLPLWTSYQDMLSSSVADLNNAGEGGFAGAITAALYLNRFVSAATPWAHIDLYGWQSSAKPGRPKGGEAMTLRACWHMLRQRFASAK